MSVSGTTGTRDPAVLAARGTTAGGTPPEPGTRPGLPDLATPLSGGPGRGPQLDRSRPHRPRLLAGIVPDSRSRLHVLRSATAAASTTPGRMMLAAFGLVIMLLVSGAISAYSVHRTANATSATATSTGPLAAAAQDVYHALSDADAAAATGFLSGSVEPPAIRDRYNADIAVAGAALTEAAGAGGAQSEAAGLVRQLATQLPVYTGLIESARTANRQQLPVGAAYLREASGLMRNTMLVVAANLANTQANRLATDQDSASDWPVASVVLLLLALIGLGVTQRWLSARTRRVLNPGLVAATAAIVIGTLWLVIAATAATTHVQHARTAGTQPLQVLTEARTTALQARSAELLNLIARSGTTYTSEFDGDRNKLAGAGSDEGLLARARGLVDDPAVRTDLDRASADLSSWLSRHGNVTQLDGSGKYEQAVAGTIGTGPSSAGQAFATFDTDLGQAIETSRATLGDQISSANAATDGLVAGLIVLTLVGVGGVLVGLGQRLREYR
jgi:hypothetical protein